MGGAWHGSVLKLLLTEHGLLEHLTDVFGEQISAGTLQTDELQRMVALTFRHIDADGTGTVTCGEFIASFMASELITVPMMARYFDDDVKAGPLRVLLDSSWHDRNTEIQQWKAAQQEKKEAQSLRESESDEEPPSWQVFPSEKLATTVKDDRINFSGQEARPPIGFEAVLRRLDALESLNLERRVTQLEADEIFRREHGLQAETERKTALDVLTVRIDEIDLAMVRLRSEVWRGLEKNEAIAKRGRSRESDSISRWSRRTPGSTPGSSVSISIPPSDRPPQMRAEDVPPVWNVQSEQSILPPLATLGGVLSTAGGRMRG